MAQRDHAAREELVARLWPLVRHVVRPYRASGHGEDLEQVAATALALALERFRPEQGTTFSTYATALMAGYVRHWLRDHDWTVRPPRQIAEAFKARVAPARARLAAELGREPSARELAGHLDMPLTLVHQAIEAGRRGVPLDAPVRGADHLTVGDTFGNDDRELDRVLDRLWLEQLASDLPELQREAIRLRYLEDLTPRQIADRLGMRHRQSVDRLIRLARDHMRDADRSTS